MRWSLVAAMFAAGASAQTLIDQGEIPALLSGIPRPTHGASLRCTIWPKPTVVDFGFRFSVGYTFFLDSGRYVTGGPHSWTVLTKVTPRDAAAKPTWLFRL
jgi:hypothetical protein